MGLRQSKNQYEVVFKVQRHTEEGKKVNLLSVNSFESFDEAVQFATTEIDHHVEYLENPNTIDAIYVSVIDPHAGATTIKKDVITYKPYDVASYRVDSTHPQLTEIDGRRKASMLRLFQLYTCINSNKTDGICKSFFGKTFE